MNKTYYLPINSVNLAHYFARGCICPTKYLQKRNKDVQDTFNSHLLFADRMFTESTNCSLEISLNEPEENVQELGGGFYLFDAPLPISRVKKIFFQRPGQKETTVFNVTSGAAFLPSNLIEVESDFSSVCERPLHELNRGESQNDWQEKIEKFNRLMGGFAIMRIARAEFQNYSPNYFSTLSTLNLRVRDELLSQQRKITDIHKWALVGNSSHEKLYKAIYQNITSETAERFAEIDGIRLEQRRGKFILDTLKPSSNTYVVANLASYGDQGRMSLDDFILRIASDSTEEDVDRERLALAFGINKGYGAFRNKYRLSKSDIDVKFKLDSQVDYYTIESIYQFAFHSKVDNREFDYLDSWCIKRKEEPIDDGIESCRILDCRIRYKKKETAFGDFYSQLFKNTSRDKIYQKIVSEIQGWIPSKIFRIDNKECNEYFEKLLETELEGYTKEIYIKTKHKALAYVDEIKTKLQNELNELNEIISYKDTEISDLKRRLDSARSQLESNSKELVSTPNSGPEKPIVGTQSPISEEPNLNGIDENETTDIKYSEQQLERYKKDQLQEIARKFDIKFQARYTKEWLKSKIIEAQKS